MMHPVTEEQRHRLPAGQPPILVVVSDTEEEFDWSKPHDRSATAVTAMPEIGRAQAVFDEFQVRPCYVIDYPVVDTEEGYGALREIHAADRCEIGAHLHPWVNPPHLEEVCARNSFPCNLPADLEESKIRVLNERIADVFGAPARTYKAGRYGIGPNSEAILERLSFEIDLSVEPDFDYSAEHGPNFIGYPYGPYRSGPGLSRNGLLNVPCSSAVAGFLGPLRLPAYRLACAVGMKLPGILARTRAADRLHLSNEGYSLDENIRLTKWLYARGERVFVFSFHSPSVVPGHTPYVQSDSDLQRFLDQFRRYFDYFFNDLGGITMTPRDLRTHLDKETT